MVTIILDLSMPLEAIKKTHGVTPETSLHLFKFYLEEQVFIKITDIVLSYTKFPERKRLRISKNVQTQISVNSNLPF